jgi:mono/diheme cytochrome c family protein
MVRPLIASVAVGAALALAACGGGSSSTSTSGGGGGGATSADSGEHLFETVGCKSCHTLDAANANGQVGPNLDSLKPTEAAVVKQVTDGGGGMPAFKDQLNAGQIQAVAKYVHDVAGQ